MNSKVKPKIINEEVTTSNLLKELPTTSLFKSITEYDENIVKAGLHLEQQKLGKIPTEEKSIIEEFREIEDIEKITLGTDTTGIDLTVSQAKALHAIQAILSKRNYRGYEEEEIKVYSSPVEGSKNYTAIKVKFKATEYLDLYGVTKKRTKRGYMEYNRNERDEALKALRELHEVYHPIFYKRHYRTEKGEERVDKVKLVKPLITIIEGYRGLTKSEDSLTDSGEEVEKKLEFVIIPSPIVVDQIDTYFVLKHSSYLEEIKNAVSKKKSSKFVYRFIDYLIAVAELKRRRKKEPVIKINYEKLAYKLKMEALIKSRQHKRVKKTLSKCYKIALRLGYLKEEVRTVKGVTNEYELIILNPDKYYQPKEKV